MADQYRIILLIRSKFAGLSVCPSILCCYVQLSRNKLVKFCALTCFIPKTKMICNGSSFRSFRMKHIILESRYVWYRNVDRAL